MPSTAAEGKKRLVARWARGAKDRLENLDFYPVNHPRRSAQKLWRSPMSAPLELSLAAVVEPLMAKLAPRLLLMCAADA
jgi:hypothetical protein